MARGVNKVILVGNLGADPDVRYSPAGSAVTKFSVATSESWKDKQTEQQQERTEWHNVVCFARLGEIAGQYLHKGSKVYIEGSLRTSSWEAQDGQKRYRTEVVAREMQMLDSRGDSAGASAPPAGADMNQQQSYAQERGSSPPEQPAAESAQPVAQPQPSAAETAPPVEDDIPF